MTGRDDAEVVEAVAGFRCSNHPDAELTLVHGTVGARVECPECHARICQGCGRFAPESWQSARCHDCYRADSRRIEAERRQRDADAREAAETAAYERGRAEGAAEVRARVEAAMSRSGDCCVEADPDDWHEAIALDVLRAALTDGGEA